VVRAGREVVVKGAALHGQETRGDFPFGGLLHLCGRARERGDSRGHYRIWANALVLDELKLYVLRVHLVGRDDKLPLAKAARENLNVKLGLELPLELKLRGSRGFNVGLLTRG